MDQKRKKKPEDAKTFKMKIMVQTDLIKLRALVANKIKNRSCGALK